MEDFLKGGWENGSVHKCLLPKSEDLSSNPQHLHKKTDMVANTCKPSSREVQTGRLRGLTGQDSLAHLTSPGSVRDPVSKTEGESERR
jgi:hypothetical protein